MDCGDLLMVKYWHMIKANQQGMVSVILLLLLLLVIIGALGFALWTPKTPSPSSSPSHSSDEVTVSGTVRFAKQGPTDGIIGYEPAIADLVIGSEESLNTWWNKSSDRKTEEAQVSEALKPTDIEITKTEEGKFKVTLKRNANILCIVSKTVSLTTDDTSGNKVGYDFYDCKKFITTKNTAKADITLIGFGANVIKCSENDCEDFTFPVD